MGVLDSEKFENRCCPQACHKPGTTGKGLQGEKWTGFSCPFRISRCAWASHVFLTLTQPWRNATIPIL